MADHKMQNGICCHIKTISSNLFQTSSYPHKAHNEHFTIFHICHTLSITAYLCLTWLVFISSLLCTPGGGFADARKKKAINSYKKLLRKEKRDSTLHEVIKR